MAAALPGPSSRLFGIGQYTSRGEHVAFEIGWSEYERDVRWAQRVLTTWGIRKADHVLITMPSFEGPWSSPVVRALRLLGAPYSNAEPHAWDARRSATFLRLLPIRAVMGMSAETAMELLAPDSVELLTPVHLIWARPAAVGPLREVGLVPAVFTALGPALALECPQRSGAHLDPDEWRPGVGPDGLTISTVGDRAHVTTDAPMGVEGRIEESPCGCGLPGPRVRLDGLPDLVLAG